MNQTEPASPTFIMRFLGGHIIEVGDPPVTINPQQSGLRVLAYLALHHKKRCNRLATAKEIWPDWGSGYDYGAEFDLQQKTLEEDDPEQKLLVNIQQALKRLRDAFDDRLKSRLDTGQGWLQFNPQEGDKIDFIKFDQAIARAEAKAVRTGGTVDIESLQEAVRLYRGPLLAGWNDMWLWGERQDLFEKYRWAIEQLRKQAMAQGEYQTAWFYVRSLRQAEIEVEAVEVTEDGWRELIQLYMNQNNFLKARIVGNALTKTTPLVSSETASLLESINAKLTELDERYPQRIRSRPDILPPRKKLIGREQALNDIYAIISANDFQLTSRLIVLTGSGGVGKTCLAVEVGHLIAEEIRFPDGVKFIDLAPVTNSDGVVAEICSVLPIRKSKKDLNEQLVTWLQSKEILLILDNCEHLWEVCANLSNELLHTCPQLHIMATSRHKFNISGEILVEVEGLKFPLLSTLSAPEDFLKFTAVKLFCARAKDLKQTFELTMVNAPSVAEICQRLDGVPLAIELAAARVRTRSPEQIASELKNSFATLNRGKRIAPERHQNLRTVIVGSYELLSPNERCLFRRLSVFVGGWTEQAAINVCSGEELDASKVQDLLVELVDSSLIKCSEESENRYYMLEMMQEYSRECLKVTEEHNKLRERHCDFFLKVVVEAEPHFTRFEQGDWFRRLEMEHANLDAALAWSLEAGSPAAFQLCGSLERFWQGRGFISEGRQWCIRALATPERQELPSERAKVLNTLGGLSIFQGDYAAAQSYLEQSLALSEEINFPGGIAASTGNLGHIASSKGDYATARGYYENVLALFQQMENQTSMEIQIGIATSFTYLGHVALKQSDYALAQNYFKQGLDLFQQMQDLSRVATVLTNLGELALFQGEYVAAQNYLTDSLTIYEKIDVPGGMANALFTLGNKAIYQGNISAAKGYYEQSITIYREIGDQIGIANSQNGLGLVALSQRNYAVARGCFTESLSLRRTTKDQDNIAAILNNLGEVAMLQGDYNAAQDYCKESLTLFREIKRPLGLAYSMEAFALLAKIALRMERAAVLWGASEILREKIGSPLSSHEREAYDRAVGEVREALGEEMFLTTWAQGRSMTQEQAVDYALGKKTI